MSQTTSVTKHKWCVLFFTRIKLVARVLACARKIAHIKWRRMNSLLSRLKLKSLDSVLRCNILRWLGHVTQSQLYTGQILGMEIEVNRSCDRPKKWNLQSETCDSGTSKLKLIKTEVNGKND